MKRRNIRSIQHFRMCHIVSAKIPIGKRCDFSWAYSYRRLSATYTPPPMTHRRLKHHPRAKTNKTMLSAFPSSVFRTKFTISILKSKQVFIVTITGLGLPVSESSTRISKFYDSLILNSNS